MAKSILLKEVPPDVFCILQQEQTKLKKQKGVKVFGIEATLYSLLREFKRCEEKEKTKPNGR